MLSLVLRLWLFLNLLAVGRYSALLLVGILTVHHVVVAASKTFLWLLVGLHGWIANRSTRSIGLGLCIRSWSWNPGRSIVATNWPRAIVGSVW